MYELKVVTRFAAAHQLTMVGTKCENMHGHNWKVEVTVKADGLDNLGMGIDFRAVKEAVNKVLDTLDHHDLNEHADFQSVNPSSENIAVYIFNNLQNSLSTDRYGVHSVTVRETDNSGVTYFGQ